MDEQKRGIYSLGSTNITASTKDSNLTSLDKPNSRLQSRKLEEEKKK